MSSDLPFNMDEVPPVFELGGAVGRTASTACKQTAHDLCTDEECLCRCHGRLIGDRIGG